jgi:hypothetical protein
MIPKIIHYCWFGRKPLPALAVRCIASWGKYFPDYAVKEWNEDNFDVNIISYTKEAYQSQKYAFVSDYARFWILYKYGGVYFDTDVEVIKPMDEILAKGAFMGIEHCGKIGVAPGLGMACTPCSGIYKEVLDLYATLSFRNRNDNDNDNYNYNAHLNLTTVVEYTTSILKKHGLRDSNVIQNIDGIYIYPSEYFCPKNWLTNTLTITPNTYTIHHYNASWFPRFNMLKLKLRHCFHLKDNTLLIKLYRLFTAH